MNVVKVKVFREDERQFIEISAKQHRLDAFKACPASPHSFEKVTVTSTDSYMPGYDPWVVLGLSTIFINIPYKFPIIFILQALRDLCGNISLEEVAYRLKWMYALFPQLDAQGNDIPVEKE